MKKRIKILFSILIGLFLVMFIGLTLWSNNTLPPSQELLSLVSENDYSVEGDFTVFDPKGTPNGKGIVIYPGALVESLAYGYLANELSRNGYLVCVLKMAFNMSIFESNKAQKFVDIHPEISDWSIIGHSMGGVSAAYYGLKNLDKVSSVIFLASYPDQSTDLSPTSLRVLSISAELDGLTLAEEIDSRKGLLPESTVYVEIVGGNHAGFGMYGDQKYDNAATITNLDQQNQVIVFILAFLETGD